MTRLVEINTAAVSEMQILVIDLSDLLSKSKARVSSIIFIYCIARKFSYCAKFAFFADRSEEEKIRTTEISMCSAFHVS